MTKLYCLTLVVVLSLGCEESRPIVPVPRIDTSTPTGEFEWAMEKLKRAVVEFQPSRRDGLQVGKRNVSYEVFPPDSERDDYTARVTIESEMVYVIEEPPDSLEEEREQQRREQARKNFERQVSPDDPLDTSDYDPVQQKFLSQMEDLAAKSHVPHGAEPTIETPQVSHRKVYELAYLAGRWQLQTEPETDYERLWFEYALGPPSDGGAR
jgi:hypothetical protein